MAQFNQNNAEQFKSDHLPVGWPWRFLVFSSLLLFISVLSFAGLTLGYEPYLNSQIKKIDANLASLSAGIKQEDKERLITTYSQSVNLKKILDSHVLSSKVFTMLEKNTSPRVYFTNMDLDVANKRVSLNGVADSYVVLSQQLAAFDNEPDIKSFLLEDSQMRENGSVQFRALLNVSDNLFK
ncbi:MAG: hypothetical protein PHP03_00150 [Candidatus Pacebacteria bacterium]|nr:hypothetical protein [Candidatus Paceibacterota bacterium]